MQAVLLTAAVAVMVAVGGGGGQILPTPPPASAPGVGFDGSIDEVVGADGSTAAGFADAEYVQLRRRDDIPPVYAPQLVSAADAGLADDALVIGLVVNGSARAYPLGILYRREMVNDVVGGVPALVSWCPLCYTALAHDRRFEYRNSRGGAAATAESASGSATAAAVFGNQGALYLGAMTWYDQATGSVWSQPLGAAIAGPLAGAELRLLPAQLAEWGRWRAAYPDTLVLTASDGAAAQPYRGRRPGEGQIVGVVIGDAARAWPYQAVAESGPVAGMVGDTPVVVWRDEATGAMRAAVGDGGAADAAGDGDGDKGQELPVIIAYRAAWLRFYPN